MKTTTLSTGVLITYNKDKTIKTCVSEYDNAVTSRPLNNKQ